MEDSVLIIVLCQKGALRANPGKVNKVLMNMIDLMMTTIAVLIMRDQPDRWKPLVS